MTNNALFFIMVRLATDKFGLFLSYMYVREKHKAGRVSGISSLVAKVCYIADAISVWQERNLVTEYNLVIDTKHNSQMHWYCKT